MIQPRLEVLISTIHAEGLQRVATMRLPEVDSVRYLVSWQMPGSENGEQVPVPQQLLRNDVVIYRSDSCGLSRNRNIALGYASAPYLLIADDDMDYDGESLKKLIDVFESYDTLDVLQLRYSGNGDNRRYPDAVVSLNDGMPKGLSVSSVEIAIRRERVVPTICFNEMFGLGAELFGCAEEQMFMLSARRAGLNCSFYPITIGHHKGVTTGTRNVTDERVIAAEGALIAAVYGKAGFLRLPLFVWRKCRGGKVNFLWGLKHIIRGFNYYTTHSDQIEKANHPHI